MSAKTVCSALARHTRLMTWVADVRVRVLVGCAPVSHARYPGAALFCATGLSSARSPAMTPVVLVPGVGIVAVAWLTRVVAKQYGSPYAATVWVYIVAFCISLCISGVWLSQHPHVYSMLGAHMAAAPGWCYLGGLVGVSVVAAGAYIPQLLSFSSYFVCTVSGQLAASMLFDRWGHPHVERAALFVKKASSPRLACLVRNPRFPK